MMKPSKYFVLEELKRLIRQKQAQGQSIRLLELGCGTAEVASLLLPEFSNVEYVGIEPYLPSFQRAQQALKQVSRATVLHGLGYGINHSSLEKPFDVCFSLSVLEHVKQLDRFLAYSTKMTKAGGSVIHLYDLGHSLHYSNWKEFIQTRLCATSLLSLVPESKVARYVSQEEVKRALEAGGCKIDHVTFHNMSSLVDLLKVLPAEESKRLISEIVQLENKTSPHISDIRKKEYLFPSVCFWSEKMS